MTKSDDSHATSRATVPPPPRSLSFLKPTDAQGALSVAVVAATSVVGLWLSSQPAIAAWLVGQVVLALAFLQWFVVLHEAGHKTLFRSRPANLLVGHVASVPALIPFYSWRRIHARHHKYTGWQDLDATTALLVPRRIAGWERKAVNLAWATWLPLFSILYRIQNYWNVPRVAGYLGPGGSRRILVRNTALLLLAYAVILAWAGPLAILRTCGLALLLSLAAQDVILLSQHTHMPTRLSGGRDVACVPPLEQERYTRSLLLPAWLSRLILGFDLHELHHMYVRVPGYDLHRIPYHARHEVNWWVWLRGAKRLSGVDFLFGSRDRTGFRL
jgi:omega-6 fatty acid desaturase (delta-12 desaturase)